MSWKRDNETNSKQSAVESLMYAQVWTQPDISYAINFLGRFCSNPIMDHWRSAKKVMNTSMN